MKITYKNRSFFCFIIILFCFTIIVARLFSIQVWHHDELSKRVKKIVYRERPETPCRGMILDRNGKILAMSVETYTLFADPNLICDYKKTKNELNKFDIILPNNITNNKESSFIPLKNNLSLSSAKKIKDLKLPGIGLVPKYKRQYPEGNMACHLLGVVGKDHYGLEGIEYIMDSYLSGKKTKDTCCRDALGSEIPEKLVNQNEISGANVYLTIDRNLQFIAEQEVESVWKKSKSKKAIIIIQDTKTGEILALACRPAYNPKKFMKSWQILRNPAISDVFEPGSTFKAITAAAALEENVVKRSEVIWCENGKYSLYGHLIRDHEKRGLLSFDGVIENSSNIGIVKICQRLTKEKLYQYIRQFGFYSQTGIDLPGEIKGLLKRPEYWSGLTLPSISFGQEIGVTAIQVVNAYTSIFNGGLLLQPRVIKKVESQNGEILYSSQERVIRRSISNKVSNDIKEVLHKVVESGTGQMAKVPDYSVGGKTGTAQKRDPKTNKYSKNKYITSFCGAIPLSDPHLTIMVIFDEPVGDYWASSTAAPVFRKVASRAVSYLRIPPDEKRIYLANVKN